MPEVVTSSVELDIRRVLRYAGDCVTLDEVMDVLARWLGGRAPLAGPGAPPTASAAQPEIRRRAAVAGAALAYYRARFDAEWAEARLGVPWQPRSASSHSGAIA
jgi:hypothetical protein